MAERVKRSSRVHWSTVRALAGSWAAGRHLRSILNVGLRLQLLAISLWAMTGPIGQPPQIVGAAMLPPSVLESGTSPRAAIYFPETGYVVGTGPIGHYFAARGGARTFGPPHSNEFTLLGSRVQIFRNFVLKLEEGGVVTTLDLYGLNAVPFRNVGNWNVPENDQALLADRPVPGVPEYGAQAQAFAVANAPDTWDGLAVGFFEAFAGTVHFEDAFPDGIGERGLLTGFAHEVWGLPVSRPQRDPQQPGIVYLRWERGVMAATSRTGAVAAVPLGEAFRAVITGEGLSPEQAIASAGSPYLSQANGPLPTGVARPEELPGTTLANAFTRSSSVAAGAIASQFDPTPTADGWYTPPTPTATPFAYPGAGGVPGYPGAPGVPNAARPAGPPLPGAIVPAVGNTVAGADPCYGDEQITFSPEILRVGSEALIAVTSSGPHPYGRLVGTERTTFVRERPGQKGYVWEWTLVLSYPGEHEYTFYVDSTIPCEKIHMTVRQALTTRTPTPTKTPRPYNWNPNNNNENDNSNNARAPAIYPLAYVIPGQDVYNCHSFQSQAQAQSVLRAEPSDPNRLDAEDGVEDGIACTTYRYLAYPNDRDFGIVQRTYGVPTPTIAPIPGATATSGPFNPQDYLGQGDRFGCLDFANQAQAQAVLRADANDPNRLDWNPRDGLACGGVEAAQDGVVGGIMAPPFDSTLVPRP